LDGSYTTRLGNWVTQRREGGILGFLESNLRYVWYFQSKLAGNPVAEEEMVDCLYFVYIL